MRMPGKGIMPVVHLKSPLQAVEMAGIAFEEGATGVFVIDHRREFADKPEYLQYAVEEVRRAHAVGWIGMNCLQAADPEDAMYWAEPVIGSIDGVWVDNALGAEEQKLKDNRLALFGGLGMKGSGYIEDPAESADFVLSHISKVDVAVVSGKNTGLPATEQKIRYLRERNPGALLASASGIDADNVNYHSQTLDYLLVASSIETDYLSGQFDRLKLRQLVELDQEYRS